MLPIALSILYLFFVSGLTKFGMLFFLIFYTVLSETHFFSTYLHLSQKKTFQYFKEHYFLGFIIPVFILLTCQLFVLNNLIIPLFAVSLLLSTHHVCMQSYAFLSINRSGIAENLKNYRKWEKYLIISASLFILLISIIKKYPSGIIGNYISNFLLFYSTNYQQHIYFLNSVALGLLITALIFLFKILILNYNKEILNKPIYFIVLLAAVLQFLPYYFVKDTRHASVFSLMFHNIQYLFLSTFALSNFQKETDNTFRKKFLSLNKVNLILLIIIILSIASALSRFNIFGLKNDFIVFLKPLLGVSMAVQILHYYFDSIIWKIPDYNLKYILSHNPSEFKAVD